MCSFAFWLRTISCVRVSVVSVARGDPGNRTRIPPSPVGHPVLGPGWRCPGDAVLSDTSLSLAMAFGRWGQGLPF